MHTYHFGNQMQELALFQHNCLNLVMREIQTLKKRKKNTQF